MLVQEQHLLFRLVQNVVKTQELLEKVFERRLFSFRDVDLEGDGRVVKQVLALVLQLSLKVCN